MNVVQRFFIYDRLISYYVQHGLPVPIDALKFQKGLSDNFIERDGMFFTATQAAEYEEKRKNTDGFAPMGIIVSDEANGIEWLKNLLRDEPKTYQQIQPEWMQAINGVRKGDILPELKEVLEDNFIEMPDGRWRLQNVQDDADKETMRTKKLLKIFRIYAEQAQKPKASSMTSPKANSNADAKTDTKDSGTHRSGLYPSVDSE